MTHPAQLLISTDNTCQCKVDLYYAWKWRDGLCEEAAAQMADFQIKTHKNGCVVKLERYKTTRYVYRVHTSLIDLIK